MGVDCDLVVLVIRCGDREGSGVPNDFMSALGFRWTLMSNGVNRHDAEPWLSLASQARRAEWKGIGQYCTVWQCHVKTDICP
jgi:hypothetical protein